MFLYSCPTTTSGIRCQFLDVIFFPATGVMLCETNLLIIIKYMHALIMSYMISLILLYYCTVDYAAMSVGIPVGLFLLVLVAVIVVAGIYYYLRYG